MRQIKFRAWDGKKMYDNDSIVVYLSAGWIENASLDSGAIHIKSGVDHLMQFTGLTDKNGVDIYESDVIESQYNYIGNIEVKFKDGKFNISDLCLAKCLVIGNIHQNKDLLGG